MNLLMVLDASKIIPAEAIEKLPTFDDKCIDLVVTAPPGFTEKGKEKIYGTSHSWDTFDDYKIFQRSRSTFLTCSQEEA